MNHHADIYGEMMTVALAAFAIADVRSMPSESSLHSMDMSSLHSFRLGSTKEHDYEIALCLSMEILSREIDLARLHKGPKSHAKTVLTLVALLRQLANMRLKGVTGSAQAMANDLTKGVASRPRWLTQYLKNAPDMARPQDVKKLTGLSKADWDSFASRVALSTAMRTAPGAMIAAADLGPVDLNVAARLSKIAAKEKVVANEPPKYDLSDRNVKIVRVSVSGFRGSAGTVELELTKNGNPADVLLWGDNGVGKSTIVDGIEFALQHRVDRSADFNSSLRSAVRNLTVSSANAEVKLSDESVIVRSLITNKAGRDGPSSFEVRPGFRIAPVVIRRADIMRFLDTDALARGTVFFDYFPDPAGTLGTRPDEEMGQLLEERFLLRVARDDLAAQLSDIFPAANVDFTDSTKLEHFVSDLLSTLDTSQRSDPIDALPDGARKVIAELRTAQQRASIIRKKLDRGVQTLNPVLYRSQLERIVPILQTVTDDLTASFKKITRAKHVKAIRVLVAKSGPVSLDVVVEFDNGASALPQQAFSEGYKDLIALLFFLAVTKKAAEFGQARVLVLDDALQSVDSGIRVGVLDYILGEFNDWQLIVTGHDRAWFSQLRGLFSRRGRSPVVHSISNWSFADGIQVTGATRTRAESLREAIERSDERMAASGIGILLEEMSQELSWRLNTSVTRREGDRYTLGDLWPGVAKTLRSTSLKDTVTEINLRLDIRNLIGAHYNEWADGIAWSDIRQLGEDTLELYGATHCGSCKSWIQKTGASTICQCGELALN